MGKKVLVADLSGDIANAVFALPIAQLSFGEAWLGALAFSAQIYFDFSAYSDMAIGIARVLGFRLRENFNYPYTAQNITEFWRRWHISLGSWLRDYLFIPLGGSRCATWRICGNLLLTMALGGLWHGASWNFVLWGVLHGALLIVHRSLCWLIKGRKSLEAVLRSAPGTACRIACTFLIVALCWVLFRAPTSATAVAVYARLASPHAGLSLPGEPGPLLCLLALGVLGHLLAGVGKRQAWARRLPAPLVGAGFAALLVLAQLLAPGSNNAFIYFQF
jgi:alginate O-acetyltransferase complex protein AlgI